MNEKVVPGLVALDDIRGRDIVADVRKIGPKPEGFLTPEWHLRRPRRMEVPLYLIAMELAERGPSPDRLRLTPEGVRLFNNARGLQGSALTSLMWEWRAAHGGPPSAVLSWPSRSKVEVWRILRALFDSLPSDTPEGAALFQALHWLAHSMDFGHTVAHVEERLNANRKSDGPGI